MQMQMGVRSYEEALNEVQRGVVNILTRGIDDYPETELRQIIAKYIRDKKVECDMTADQDVLTDYIYHDMAGLSFITREKIFAMDGFEELDVNAWNSVELIISGTKQLTDFSFLSPQHAVDIIQRVLRRTQTPFDVASPRATADIGSGIRITALREPLVDSEVGVAASIRKVNTETITPDKLLQGTLTAEMMTFLRLCLAHGASICVSGSTGAGKTTIAGALLADAAKTKRVYTIEEGSREWDFRIRDGRGKTLNSIIHTKTRPNENNPAQHITQEELVKDALRFDPDIVAPGEIRGREAFEVMGVANTGHTVITTVHANSALDAPERVVTLAKKAYDMTDATLYSMYARAFRILVHIELCADRVRRVTEIREVLGCHKGELSTSLLYEYTVQDNVYEGEQCIRVNGAWRRGHEISGDLTQFLLKKGARRSELTPYLTEVSP